MPGVSMQLANRDPRSLMCLANAAAPSPLLRQEGGHVA